jgi:hypothetical protein
MNEHTMEAKNDLERQMEALHGGQLAPESFFESLLGQQVFLPVRDEDHGIANFQASQKAVPLSLEAEDGTQVLILFSSPERAKEFLSQFPGFTGGILESFRWVLQKMGGGYGVSINPDSDQGVDLEPDAVTQLAQQVAGEEQ